MVRVEAPVPCGRFESLQLEGPGIELVILALLFQQLVVCAALDDAAVVHDHDHIGVADGGQAVGDHEDRAAFHEGVHAGLDDLLGAGIDGGSGLVQDHDRGVGHGRAGDGDQLALALGQAGSVALKDGVITVGEHADEAVGVGQLGGGDAFVIRGVQLAIADVIHNSAGEEVHILQDDAQGLAQVLLVDVADVDPVIEDGPAVDVVETVDQVGDRGFAGAGGADQAWRRGRCHGGSDARAHKRS